MKGLECKLSINPKHGVGNVTALDIKKLKYRPRSAINPLDYFSFVI